MSVDGRSAIAAYEGKRVTISGIFAKLSQNQAGNRMIRTALLQDVYAEADGKEMDVDHTWLQHAKALEAFDLHEGDRVKMSCRVRAYTKHLDPSGPNGRLTEKRYGFHHPENIEVTFRVRRDEPIKSVPDGLGIPEGFREGLPEGPLSIPSTPLPPQPVLDADEPDEDQEPMVPTSKILITVRRLKDIAKELGGWESLMAWVEALRD